MSFKSLTSKANLSMGFVQGLYWMASCIFMSYMVRLLNGFGYSDYHSGLILTVSSFAALTVQPVMGRLADKVKSVKALIIACLLTAQVCIWLIRLFYSNIIAIAVIVFVAVGAFRALVYIIDLWSISVCHDDPSFSYGFTRSFGAVFYAVSAVLFGYVIDELGSFVIIYFFSALCFALLALVISIRTENGNVKDSPDFSVPASNLGSDLKTLFSNKSYVVLLVSYTFIEASCVANQNYLTRKFQELGAGDVYTGLSFLVMGLLQLLPLLMLNKIKKKNSPFGLMLICFIGLNMRNLIMGFSKTALGTVSCFVTEPFAFGLYIGVFLYYMNTVLPPRLKYLGTTLYSSITQGIGGMVGNYAAGLLSQRFGVLPMMKLIAAPAAAGLLIYLVYFFTLQKKALRP
ncbi:MAG: MFS transporter [Sphaerochaeta sp.]